ncbi:hypothetical protein [Streptomyces sp.]|uniref:hypothetical protein n=1 Tax=Streptomyces sp. TaxID=1931 RepID=UPI002F42CF1F
MLVGLRVGRCVPLVVVAGFAPVEAYRLGAGGEFDAAAGGDEGAAANGRCEAGKAAEAAAAAEAERKTNRFREGRVR